MSRIILVIRRSVDYWLEDKLVMPSCPDDEKFWNSYKSHIVRAIDWWNESFQVPYLEFRKKFRRIPAQLIADSQFDMVLNHLDWRVLSKIGDLSNTWIVPQDEDDWPNPALPKTLRSVNTKMYDGVVWDVHRICECNSKYITCDLNRYNENVLLSNAYAVRVDSSERAIVGHTRAQGMLSRSDSVRYINRPLAVKVDGPASMSLLKLVKSKEHLQTLVYGFKANTLEVPEVYREAYRKYCDLVWQL